MGIKMSSSNDPSAVAVTSGKRKHRESGKLLLFGFNVLEKFLHNHQEFCFVAFYLNNAIKREEGNIIPKC